MKPSFRVSTQTYFSRNVYVTVEDRNTGKGFLKREKDAALQKGRSDHTGNEDGRMCGSIVLEMYPEVDFECEIHIRIVRFFIKRLFDRFLETIYRRC